MHDGKMTQKGEFHQQKLESKASRVGKCREFKQQKLGIEARKLRIEAIKWFYQHSSISLNQQKTDYNGDIFSPMGRSRTDPGTW